MDEPQQETQQATTVQKTVSVTTGPQEQSTPFSRRNEWSRIVTGWAIVIGFFSVLLGLLMKYEFEIVKDIIMIMVGVLCAKLSTIVDFDFGGSASSNAKTQIMANKP